MMWSYKSTSLTEDVRKVSLYEGETPLSYEKVISLWKDSAEFRTFYFSILQDSSFDAFFWENPPLARSTINQPYEFVLTDSPQLARITADSSPFLDHFNPASTDQTVITISNLGHDAELIVPCPVVEHSHYTHIASFVRNAPESQQHDLIKSMSSLLGERVNDKPTWLSTSGLGVYWLHIRLDIRPKYYSYQPYRQFAEQA